MTDRHRRRLQKWFTHRLGRRGKRAELRGYLHKPRFESLEDRRLLATDFGDAPDSIAGTSPKGVFDDGADFRITTVTPDDNHDWSTNDPAMAYNPDLNQYLVVYHAARFVFNSDGEQEVFGTIVDASTGAVVQNHFRISSIGADNDEKIDADRPSVAYDPVNTQYLVVWDGDVIDGKNEIHGQRVDADGTLLGINFQISSQPGGTSFDAIDPVVAYGSTPAEFMVVWQGETATNQEEEIYGQRVRATDGVLQGTNFQISDRGTPGSADFDAERPHIVYNATANEYYVAYHADRIPGEKEIFGIRLTDAGAFPGGSRVETRLSFMGVDNNVSFDGEQPKVAWNATDNEYLVVWQGDVTTINNEEIFAQRVAADGTPLLNNFQVSSQSATNDTDIDALAPHVAWNSSGNEYLVVWEGDRPTVNNESEVFGRRVSSLGTMPDDIFRISNQGSDGNTNFGAFSAEVAYNSVDDAFLTVWNGTRAYPVPPSNSGEFEIFGQLQEFRGTPDYETLLSENGPRHTTSADIFLGAGIPDDEADGQPTVTADGDDMDAGGNDEDGVNDIGQLTMIEGFAPSIDLTVVNTTGSTASLFGWIDFNGDGVFDDDLSTEKAVVSAVTGVNTLVFPVIPPGAASETYARFRLSTDGAASLPTGAAADGEVEDYPVTILIAEIDVEGNGVGITNGDASPDLADHTDFGPVDIAAATSNRTFTIINNGTAVLDLGAAAVSITGTHASDFTITAQPPDTVAVGTSETFQIEFDPAALGVREATVSINNNDPDESPFTFEIAGTGIEFLDYGDGPDAEPGALGVGIAEIGSDFRISESDIDTATSIDAADPAVAYNFDLNQYLVVWESDEEANSTLEVYGQIVAGDGSQVVDDFRITVTGPEGNDDWDADNPSVAYNPATAEYLVVFEASRHVFDFNNNTFVEDEIFAQRVSSSGTLLGNAIRVSTTGPDDSADYQALNAAVVYGATPNEFLVVFSATRFKTGSTNNNPNDLSQEFEIFGQRIAADGSLAGGNFRISTMGPDDDTDFQAENPDVQYNPTDNQYLVAWEGDGALNGKDDIHIQLVNPDGTLSGSNVQVSALVPGDDDFDSEDAAIAYNSTDNQYLVVWEGEDNTGILVNNEEETFGQVISNTGSLVGGNFRVSFQGLDGDAGIDSRNPDVSYSLDRNEYIVVWYGPESVGVVISGEDEIWGQRISNTGSLLGNRLQISQQGPPSNSSFDARDAAMAANLFNGEFMLVWEGDIGSQSGKDEIHAQRVEFAGTADLITLLAEGGPRHAIVPGIKLGAQVDAELDALASSGADGDDNDPPDDEDGVVDPASDLTLIKGEVPAIDIVLTNTTGSTATLYGWIDYDADGEFEDATEKSTLSVLTGAMDDTVTMNFPPVPDNAFNTVFMRLRFSTDPAADSQVGRANDGEVEDYLVNVVDGDLGDAPISTQSGFAKSYPTRIADGGAIHKPVGPTLGPHRDTEPNGQANPGAVGDDVAGSPNDEDGVTFVSATLIASPLTSRTGQVQVDLQNADATSNKLDAWIDFNRDGDWDDSGEQIFTDFDLGNSAGTQTLDFTIPQDNGANVDVGQTFARFRLSTAGGLMTGGFAADGEVEDHAVTFVAAVDYGDAPDTASGTGNGNYNTLSTDSGPSHALAAGLHIGAALDDETEAFQSPLAGGDDSDNTDDEDGIAGAIVVTPGTTPTLNVTVTNTTPTGATLYGWIDYDGNGLFDNISEGATAVVSAGTNGVSVALDFPIVPGSFAPSTFARLRLSTDAAASDATGPALDGEVEDHPVTIAANMAPSISVGDLNYTEDQNGGNPVVIDAGAIASDADGDADWNGGSLAVQITAGGEAGDEISVQPIGDITVNTGNGQISHTGTHFATADVSSATVTNNATLTINFNANATNTFVQDLVRAVSYRTTSDVPGTLVRTATFMVIDNNSGNGSDTSTISVAANNDPASLSLTNTTTSLLENTDTSSDFKVADVVISDPDGGSNNLTLSGADNAFFSLTGTRLFLLAGTSLDFEAKPSYSLDVNVDDAGVPGNPDDVVPFTLTLIDVNEPPVVQLHNAVTSLLESTILNNSLKVGDVVVVDDALGDETLALSGNDAASFELQNGDTELHLKQGTPLDFETKSIYQVTVEVDDSTLGINPDSTVDLTLQLIDVFEPPEVDVSLGADDIPNQSAVNFGEAAVGAPKPSRTFTVTNNGTGDLVLQPITVPLGFALTSANFTPNQVLVPGAQTTFTVEMETATGGSAEGELTFASNDSSESLYRINLSGAIITPAQNPTDLGADGLVIDNGDSGYHATGGWTDVPGFGFQADAQVAVSMDGARRAIWAFGNLSPGQFEVSLTWLHGSDRSDSVPFVIRDGIGGAILASSTLSQKSLPSGPVVSGRPFQQLDNVTITGDTLTVEISNAGTNDAVIADAVLIKSITPPPNTPEITVRTASVIIDDGTSLSFAAVTQGDASSQDFIVRNDGTADLILQPITVGGSAFSLGSPNFTVNQVLAPGNEVTFTIDVNTATAGTFNGSVSLASDDADESPFDLTLAAIVHPPGATEFLIDDGEPGFALTGNWNNVPSFGYQADAKVITANLSGTATWTFTGLTASLFNVSTTWLHGSDRATSVSYVVRDGVGGTVLATVPVSQKSAPAGMVIGGRPFASLADVTLTTDTLVVELTNAGTDGAVIADAVRIESFVPPSNSPEITVTQDAATVVDDGSFSFGSAEQNDPQLTKTFVVTNTGTANLILEPITVTGTGFTLTSANFTPGQTLIPNATASLTVGLATATLGTFNGTVSLANNDGDENPFNFDISGSINVAQPPGIEIKDNGDSGFSATGDWLDVSGYGYALDALAGNDTNGTDTAKWVFDSLTPGDYEVSATWLRAGDRDTNVSYVIRDGDGGPILGTVVVDQTQNAVGTVYGGRPFEVLNVFTISGTTLVVELSTLGTTKAVIADAVRIEMQ